MDARKLQMQEEILLLVTQMEVAELDGMSGQSYDWTLQQLRSTAQALKEMYKCEFSIAKIVDRCRLILSMNTT